VLHVTQSSVLLPTSTVFVIESAIMLRLISCDVLTTDSVQGKDYNQANCS
jgi:hypothetical protein